MNGAEGILCTVLKLFLRFETFKIIIKNMYVIMGEKGSQDMRENISK